VSATHPWWWEYPTDPYKSDFRNLMYLIWEHMGLPSPTPAQYDIAYFLQHGWAGYGRRANGEIFEWFGPEEVEPNRLFVERLAQPTGMGREDIIEAFRGIGKSYATSGYCLWRLLRDPINEKIMVLSATKEKASQFVSMTKMLLLSMPIFEHLIPREDQRDQANQFDVNGASISQSPSMIAKSITGQITGSRATLIVPDDIETPENARTEEARQLLMDKTDEFSAIKVTGGKSDVILLGTPQTEESIYAKLICTKGYLGWILPARYPGGDKRDNYKFKREGGAEIDCLSPRARAVDLCLDLVGRPTDPERFNDMELANRESKGRAYFALQYQMDTSLSDAERYPLKVSDLIVMACNGQKAPSVIQWGHDSSGRNKRKDLENPGFTGDYWLGPLFVDPEWRTYEQSIMAIDPSGRGKDETAWVVIKVLNGMFFLVASGGFAGDMGIGMQKAAEAAYEHKVNEIVVEPNYAGQVWIAAFEPILAKVWPPEKPGDTAGCSVVEGAWSKGQKEVRIADTLEPVMNRHRLIVDESVAADETLMYQLTHLSRDRGCLTHDDRVDALALAVAHLVNALRVDVDEAHAAAQEADEQEWLDSYARAFDRMKRGDPRFLAKGWAEDPDGDEDDYVVYSTTAAM
jgi:hypothetical protein